MVVNPILHEGGLEEPPQADDLPSLLGECDKWVNFSWLCSFQHSTWPSKSIFGISFQFFEKFVVEDIWSTKILSRNLKKSKKIQFFSMKSYFLLLNLNSTCSHLSFEVYNVSVAQNLKFYIFLPRKFFNGDLWHSSPASDKSMQLRRLFLVSMES